MTTNSHLTAVADDTILFLQAKLQASYAGYPATYDAYGLSKPGTSIAVEPIREFRRVPRPVKDAVDVARTPSLMVRVATNRPSPSRASRETAYERGDATFRVLDDRRIAYDLELLLEVFGNRTLVRREPVWDAASREYFEADYTAQALEECIYQRDALADLILQAVWGDPAMTVDGSATALTSFIGESKLEERPDKNHVAVATAAMSLHVLRLLPAGWDVTA